MRTWAIVTLAVLSGAVLRAQPADGIKVHGHWVIEVKQPDGALAQRREFENGLVLGGHPTLLPLLVGRGAQVGGWRIQLNGPFGPCPQNANGYANCSISEAGHPDPGGPLDLMFFTNLDVAILHPYDGDPDDCPGGVPHCLRLRGSAISHRNDASVSQVTTHFSVCRPTSGTPICEDDFAFTAKDLSPLISNISRDQTIDVKVFISFS